MNHWKVDMCELRSDPNAVGFIFSKGSSQNYPQQVGIAWSYYATPNDVDSNLEVKCKV
jgi:hypothetical protein